MPRYDFPNVTQGFDEAIIDVATTVPTFTITVLFFVFGVIFVGGILAESKRRTTADTPMWFAVASLGTLLVALPLTITEGAIDIFPLGVLVTMVILSGVWLYLSRDR